MQKASIQPTLIPNSKNRCFLTGFVRKTRLVAALGILFLIAFSASAAKLSPPAAPSNLAASTISSSQISLSWADNSSNESGFKVDRATSSSGPWSIAVATVGAGVTSYTDSGLNPSTTYYYRVYAYNSKGNSSYSSVASATTFAAPPPPACTYSLSSSSASFGATGGSGSFNVTAGSGCSWTASSGASWLTITGGGSGSGGGTVSFSAAANSSTSPLSASITVSGQGTNLTFTVSEAAASSGGGSGPSAYWTFDSASVSGATVSDVSGTGNNGALSGNSLPPIVPGKIAQAVSLDGVSQVVNVPDSPSLNITGPFTVATWVNFSTLPNGGQYPNIVAKLTSPSSGYGYGLFWYSTGVSGIIGSGSPSWTITSPYIPTAGTWTHYVVVFDGANLSLYVNGSLYTQTPSSAPADTTGVPVQMGPHYSNPSVYGYINALLDDARIYNRALSASEISQLYTSAGSSSVTISTGVNPAGAGTTSGGGTVVSGANVTVTASANSGYAFANWTENGTVVTNSASYSFLATANRNLVATFTSTACTYSLNSTSASFGAAGGGGSVNVTASAGTCSWSASTAYGWIHTSSSGNGNGTASYTVDVNGSSASRSGTLTIAGKTLTVNQSGHSAPVANAGPSQSAAVGTALTFNGSGSAYDGAYITSYNWTFGDLGTASGASVSHTYSAAGAFTATLTVNDSFGASASSGATVTITNSVAPLSVNLTAPSAGATVSGTINLGASASSSASRVDFYCDNQTSPLGSSTSVPFSFPCDTTLMANGGHTLYCKAYDALGNSANSPNVSVTVNNTTGTGTGGQLQLVKTMLSSAGNAPVNCVATDHSGNTIVVGYFNGFVNVGTGSIASIPTSASGNIYLAKYSPQGALQWLKILYGTGNDIGRGVAIDSNNNIIIVGNFQGTLDFGGGALTSLANENMFAAKYSPTGTHLWSVRLGGTYSDAAYAVAVDSANNVLLTGRFTSVNANYGSGWTLSAVGSQNIALVKLSGSTGSTTWAKAYGGSGYNQPQGLVVDRNGDVAITGFFFPSTDLGNGALSSAGASDIFLAKYSGVDGSYKWGKRLGSTSGDSGVGLAADPNTGNVIVTGGYNGVVDFGGGGMDTFNNGGIYLAGYDPLGNYLWSLVTGGSGDSGMGVSIDASGNLALAGKASYGIYFGGTQSLLGNGQMNSFVAAFTVSGNAAPVYRWAKTVGSSSAGASTGNSVALDGLGHILVGGSFMSTVDFGGISVTAGAPGYSSGFLSQYTK